MSEKIPTDEKLQGLMLAFMRAETPDDDQCSAIDAFEDRQTELRRAMRTEHERDARITHFLNQCLKQTIECDDVEAFDYFRAKGALEQVSVTDLIDAKAVKVADRVFENNRSGFIIEVLDLVRDQKSVGTIDFCFDHIECFAQALHALAIDKPSGDVKMMFAHRFLNGKTLEFSHGVIGRPKTMMDPWKAKELVKNIKTRLAEAGYPVRTTTQKLLGIRPPTKALPAPGKS